MLKLTSYEFSGIRKVSSTLTYLHSRWGQGPISTEENVCYRYKGREGSVVMEQFWKLVRHWRPLITHNPCPVPPNYVYPSHSLCLSSSLTCLQSRWGDYFSEEHVLQPGGPREACEDEAHLKARQATTTFHPTPRAVRIRVHVSPLL